MTSLSQAVLGFLATYLVHSTLFMGLAWLASRHFARSHAWRETMWKAAVVGGLVTSVLAQLAPWSPLQFELPAIGDVPTAPSVVAGMDRPLLRATANGAAVDATVPANDVTANETSAASAIDGTAALVEAPSANEATLADGTAAAGEATSANESTSTSPFITLDALGDWPWTTILFGTWLVTSLVLIVRFAWRMSRVSHAFGRRRPVYDGALLGTLEELRRAGGIRSRLRLTVARSVPSPVALPGGEICVPERLLTELSAEEQRAALAHELAHLARGDARWLAGTMVLECLFFFQPLLRVARHALRDAAEYQSDAWAVGILGERRSLASCLVQVAQWVSSKSPDLAGTMAMVERGSPLSRRVHRLLEGRWDAEPSARLRWSGALAFVALVGAFAPVVGAARPSQPVDAAAVAPAPTAELAVATPELVMPADDPLPNPEPGPTAEEFAAEVTPDEADEVASETVAPSASDLAFPTPRIDAPRMQIPLAAAPLPGQPSPVNVPVAVERSVPPPTNASVEERAADLGSLIERTDIEETAPTTRTADLFRSTTGVRALCDVVRCRIEGRRGFTGFDDDAVECEMQYFVDNVPQGGNVPDFDVALIESVEIYTGVSQIPSQYLGPQAICGVVVIRTRR